MLKEVTVKELRDVDFNVLKAGAYTRSLFSST